MSDQLSKDVYEQLDRDFPWPARLVGDAGDEQQRLQEKILRLEDERERVVQSVFARRGYLVFREWVDAGFTFEQAFEMVKDWHNRWVVPMAGSPDTERMLAAVERLYEAVEGMIKAQREEDEGRSIVENDEVQRAAP